MKNCGKKILSVALAAAMSCSVISAFANTVSIESIKVLNNASDAGTAADKSSVSLTPEQLLQVTVKLSPDSGATLSAGDITFLSYKGDGTTLDNTTIQYVDQQTTTIDNNAGTATITFRPRTGLGTGTFTAKAGGTDVTTAESFNYTVAEASKTMTMTADTQTITAGGSVVITLKDSDNAPVEGAAVTATAENVAAVSGTTDSKGQCTLTFTTAGTYTISAVKDNYTLGSTITVQVNSASTSVPTEDVDSAKAGLEEAIKNIPTNSKSSSITLPSDKVTTDNNQNGYEIKYEISSNEAVQLTGNELKLADNYFGAKVQLTAKLGDNVADTKTVYLFATGTDEESISFGNIDMIAAADGSDAFADDDKFKAISDYDYTAAAAEILNLALGRGNIANVPKGAVDINLDGNVTLAEYRMFKLLIDSSETYYVPSNFAAARSSATKSGN